MFSELFLVLSQISSLDCRIKLWLFKLDFNIMIKDICAPYHYLKEGLELVKKCNTLALIISLTLRIGNLMNRTKIECFTLDSLLKLSSIKDSSSKKTLLYFIVKSAQDNSEDIENLTEKYDRFNHIAKTDFNELTTNLKLIEDQCKNALGYLKLAASYDRSTKTLVEDFLAASVKDILSFQLVVKVSNESFSDFLCWLGNT